MKQIKMLPRAFAHSINLKNPDVDAHEVLQRFDSNGGSRDEKPETFLESESGLDLLENDLVGDQVA